MASTTHFSTKMSCKFALLNAQKHKKGRTMLFVNTNVSALSGMNALTNVSERLNRSFEQLSSGSRINSAKDDAAGLMISNRLDTQVIGTQAASKNISDAISAMQIADGAMEQTTQIAFRMRQIAVQMSNGVWSQEERDNAQKEVDELIIAATNAANHASFGEKKLLDGPQQSSAAGSDEYILGRLAGMLEQSEANIKAYLGLEADGKDEVDIVLDKPGAVGGVIAFVTFAGQDVINITADYADFAAPEPNALPIKYIDRVVAHEMVHAVTANQLPPSVSSKTWFMEGVAELIHGADERLNTLIGGGSAATFMSSFAGGFSGSDTAYAQSFVAARMIHSMMKEEGYGNGIATFMKELKSGTDLDGAFTKFFGINEAGFIAHVAEKGGDYIDQHIDYTNDDTGAIGGLDADGLGVKNAINAVGDSSSYSKQPLKGFKVNWPAGFNPLHTKTFSFQTGFQPGERNDFQIRGGTAERIGLSGVNVSANPIGSIEVIDRALSNIHEIRAELGSSINEMLSYHRNNQSTIVNVSDAKSRIKDTDFAVATAELTRNQIIQQASSTILAQANQRPNIALSLLR